MSVSYKYLRSYFTKQPSPIITQDTQEYILDNASLWRKQYERGIQNYCTMVYGTDHFFLYTDSQLTNVCGFPSNIIDSESGLFLLKMLPLRDQYIHMYELHLLMKHYSQNKKENMVYRAKIKINSIHGRPLWAICDVPLLIKRNDSIIGNVSMIHDFSTTKKDNFHKYFYINKDTEEILYRNYHPSSSITDFYLTRREIQIINLLADGFTSAEIADKLSVQADTVRKHRKNVIEKLSDQIKIRNTPHLVKFACQHGMIMDNSEFENIYQKEEFQDCFQDYNYENP